MLPRGLVPGLMAIVALSCFASSSVHGQEAAGVGPSAETDDETASALDREARALFAAGREAFSQGRFEAALGHFERAYEASPRWRMLYNIAVTADRLRRDSTARDAYRGFLAELPQDDPTRPEIEARLRVLDQIGSGEGSDDAVSTAEVTPATGPAAPPAETRDGTPAIVVLSASAAAVVAGGVLLAIGIADYASVEGAMGVRFETVRDAYDRAPVLQGAGAGAAGVGLVGVLVGALLLPSGGPVAVSAGPGTIALRARF